MQIGCQCFCDTPLFHDNERNTICQSPLLIEAGAIQLEGGFVNLVSN
jgi:hypothetical protein